ncbi:MAG TPA: hypothetical protein VJ885_05160 [Thermoanaerobaculia bacterium]|nr:hypothetical protein [Thermoanaerobaculia bacterium]
MKLRFLYPADPRNAQRIDERFALEAADLFDQGFEISVVDVGSLLAGQARLSPPVWSGQRAVYRGWPLPEEEHAALAQLLQSGGGVLISTDLTLRERGNRPSDEREEEDEGTGYSWAPQVWEAVN